MIHDYSDKESVGISNSQKQSLDRTDIIANLTLGTLIHSFVKTHKPSVPFTRVGPCCDVRKQR